MAQAKGVSLHVGLNAVDPSHYGGWSGPLVACEADGDDMELLARDRGFTTRSLKTGAATRKAVLGGIRDAAKQLAKGDFFLLTYSGHGGQVPDIEQDDDDEPDLLDETWCAYDGEILDDELYMMWREFRAGVRILMLSDSCHSGTVARMALSEPANGTARGALRAYGVDGDSRFRVMPEDVARRTYRQNAAFYDNLQRKASRGRRKGAARKRRPRFKTREDADVQASVRLISGCQDNQLSSDGAFNGLFTGVLLRIWNGGKFKGSYGTFHQAIGNRMPPTQSPKHFKVGVINPAYDAQQPFQI
jgi:hypothetical protein